MQAKRQAQSRLVSMLLDDNSTTQSTALIGTKRTYGKIIHSRKLLNCLASPTGFEPVLSP